MHLGLGLGLAGYSRRNGGFSPATLFALAEPGVWFDPSDLTTLFQDPAGTTPVTGPTGPTGLPVTVGLMLDKSKGLALGAELVANGDFSGGATTGWTAINSTLAVVSGQLEVAVASSGNSYSRTYQVLTTSANTTYQVDIFVGSGTSDANNIYLLLDGAVPGNSGIAQVKLNVGANRLVFRAVNTTTYFAPSFYCTALGQTRAIDNVSVRELAGNHATQAITASQPIYGIVPAGGRRNLLLQTEAFNEAVWAKDGATITTNAIVAPDGTLTGDKLIEAATTAVHRTYQSVTVANSTPHTTSIYAKAGERNWISLAGTTNGRAWFNLSTGVVGTVNATLTASIQSVGGGWYRCSVTQTTFTTTGYFDVGVSSADNTYSYTGDGTSGIFIWGAQLEQSATATPYQRVTTQYDVTEAGVASLGYLRFDGTDDFMRTTRMPTIAQPYQMWAALEPTAFVAGNYTYIFDSFDGTNRAYLAFAGGTGSTTTGNYRMAAVTEIASATILSAGSRYVATASFSGAASEVRSNGVSVLTGDAGIGSFDGLTIGTRFSNSSYQNGKFFGGIVHGGAVTAARINATEAWLNDRTGAY